MKSSLPALLPAFFFVLGFGSLLASSASGDEPKRLTNTALPDLPFAAAVELGDFVYVSGALGTLPGSRSLADGTAAQVKQTLDNLDATLKRVGLDLSRVVEARVYLSDIRLFPAVDAEMGRRFGDAPPTMTVVEAALALPGAEVEIAVLAARNGVAIENVLPAGWSRPRGNYRRALRVGDHLFLAGQIGYDVKTGITAAGTAAQARQALANVKSLVEAAGLSLKNVAGCRVFLADARDFPLLNEAWKEAFPTDPPVRETLQGKLGDTDLKIEVHCVAVQGPRQVIQPAGTTPGSTPFSPAIKTGGLLYTAGMVARTPEGWPAGAGEQTRVILAKLKAALDAAGLSPNDVVDATVVLSDPRYYEAMNAEYRKFFPAGFPARVTAALPLMAPEALVEISFIARGPAAEPY